MGGLSFDGNFYPRSHCGERLCSAVFCLGAKAISIHALLAESDRLHPKRYRQAGYFYPRSPCGERPFKLCKFKVVVIFLSTLSLRRATAEIGECWSIINISIHALLAESDSVGCLVSMPPWYFYPRSPCGERLWNTTKLEYNPIISIHALLAESDHL